MSNDSRMATVNHYLLTFDRLSGHLDIRSFEGADSGHVALKARFEAEKESTDPNVEIVVIQAASVDNIRRTHSRYFMSLGELVEDFESSLAEPSVA